MKVWTLQVQVDREVLQEIENSYGGNRKYYNFSTPELEEMEGLANELCSKLEKFGYVRMQSQ